MTGTPLSSVQFAEPFPAIENLSRWKVRSAAGAAIVTSVAPSIVSVRLPVGSSQEAEATVAAKLSRILIVPMPASPATGVSAAIWTEKLSAAVGNVDVDSVVMELPVEVAVIRRLPGSGDPLRTSFTALAVPVGAGVVHRVPGKTPSNVSRNRMDGESASLQAGRISAAIPMRTVRSAQTLIIILRHPRSGR